MIYGIGTDILQISRLEATLGRHGDRFAAKILGPQEIMREEHGAICGALHPAHAVAARTRQSYLRSSTPDATSCTSRGLPSAPRGTVAPSDS